MMLSVTGQYVLLSISQGKHPDGIMNYDFLGAAISLGLYELEKNNVLEVIQDEKDSSNITISLKKGLPDNLAYLSHLYEAINVSEKRTISDIISVFCLNTSNKYYKQFTDDLMMYLEKNGDLVKETKKGFLNWEREVLTAKEESVHKTLDHINVGMSAEAIERDIIVIAKILQKTGLLYLCFSKDKSKIIKQRLELEEDKSSEDIVSRTMNTLDKILGITLALISTLL